MIWLPITLLFTKKLRVFLIHLWRIYNGEKNFSSQWPCLGRAGKEQKKVLRQRHKYRTVREFVPRDAKYKLHKFSICACVQVVSLAREKRRHKLRWVEEDEVQYRKYGARVTARVVSGTTWEEILEDGLQAWDSVHCAMRLGSCDQMRNLWAWRACRCLATAGASKQVTLSRRTDSLGARRSARRAGKQLQRG